MHRIGRFIFQGRMRPFPVVDPNGLRHHLRGLLQVCRTVEQKFPVREWLNTEHEQLRLA
jgi:hypothetical protein